MIWQQLLFFKLPSSIEKLLYVNWYSSIAQNKTSFNLLFAIDAQRGINLDTADIVASRTSCIADKLPTLYTFFLVLSFL